MGVDITEQADQEAIADSIIGDSSNIVWQGSQNGMDRIPELSEIEEQSAEDLGHVASREELEAIGALQGQDEQNAEQFEPAEAAEAQPEAGLSLDEAVEHYQLNDPEMATALGASLTSAWGSRPDDIDAAKLGATMAKTTLSVAQLYDSLQGDPSRLPMITPEGAQQFTSDFLAGFGIDPRVPIPVNPQLLTETVFNAAWNFLRTYDEGGRVADVARLNDLPSAMHFYQNFLASFGIDPSKANPMHALKVADAAGTFILGTLGKLQGAQQRTQSRGKVQTIRPPASRLPKNDMPTQLENEYAPKSRTRDSTKSQFKTNKDIFTDEVMDELDRKIL